MKCPHQIRRPELEHTTHEGNANNCLKNVIQLGIRDLEGTHVLKKNVYRCIYGDQSM